MRVYRLLRRCYDSWGKCNSRSWGNLFVTIYPSGIDDFTVDAVFELIGKQRLMKTSGFGRKAMEELHRLQTEQSCEVTTIDENVLGEVHTIKLN